MFRLIEAATVLLFACAGGFVLGSTLSPDAISMALGIFFGILAASLPVMLVVAHMTRQKRHEPPTPPRSREPDWLDEPETWELIEQRANQLAARKVRAVMSKQKYIEVK